MNARTVRMPVNQHFGAMPIKRADNRLLIHIHEVCVLVTAGQAAVLACFAGQLQTLPERQG